MSDSRNAPCKDCPDRHTACHDRCQEPEYLAFRAMYARAREARRRESELLAYTIKEMRKNQRGRR